MFTTDEYLDQLETDMDTLKSNLELIGVEVTEDDNFTTLSQKVKEIANLNPYFNLSITDGSNEVPGYVKSIKKLPAFTNTGVKCSNMFYNYQGTEIDLSKFNTSTVTDFFCMFYGCKNLTEIDVSYLNTYRANSLYGMFRDCTSLTTLDLSNFNTDVVTNFSFMFNNCKNLTELNISSFTTKENAQSTYMFANCNKLTKLDMRNFEFDKLSSGNGSANMFSSFKTDCLIIVKDDTQKTWLNTKFSTLTNVKTVAEYEGQ